MKIRLDFVTNSSSSSFVAYSIHSKELADYIKSLVDQGKQEGGTLAQGLFSTKSLGELQIFGDAEIVMVQEAAGSGISLNNCQGGDSRNLRQRVDDNLRLHDYGWISYYMGKFFRLSRDEGSRIWNLAKKAYNEDQTNCKTYMGETDSFTAVPLPPKKEFWVEGSTLVRHEIFQTRKTVEVPQGIKKIGYRAFAGNIGSDLELEEILLPEGVTEIEKQAFSGCRAKRIVLPSTLRYIREGAFLSCGGLKEILLPDSVQTIESKAFKGCAGLVTVVMPGVTEIQSEAFSGCARIKEFRTSDRVDTVADDAFSKSSVSAERGKDGGFTFTIIEPKPVFRLSTKGVLTKYNGNDSEVDIPDNVTAIGKNAFEFNHDLTAVRIPDGITVIDNCAFYACTNLKEIRIPHGVKKIGENAFRRCERLERVWIPDTVKSIGSGAFWDCESLTEIDLPDSVKSIGENAFSHCGKLEKILLPDRVKEIGKGAFKGCPGLADENGFVIVKNTLYDFCKNDAVAVIPDGVTGISTGAFQNCTGLTEVRIPDGVLKIENSAFSHCTNLLKVNIPDSVTQIGQLAFSGCTSLTEIRIPASVTQIKKWVFAGCENLTIYGAAGSCAEQFAREENIPFVAES